MKSIPVYFSAEMVADSRSYSPSAAKPLAVVESWKRLGVPLELRAPNPVTRAQFSAVHSPEFVDGVLECQVSNGFGNREREVARSLPFTSGAMTDAAREALRNGRVAVAPCSGFHHARYRGASGFCTFNGLMVAAEVLRHEGATRIGIVDCDMHYGDGTDAIIESLGAQDWIRHFTAGAKYQRPSQVAAFFRELRVELQSMRDCDVILYQAGADPHIHDPLGGWLTTAQLRERDQLVFESLRESGTPVAWNLAGGYQVEPDGSIPKLLEIHDNTMRETARVFLT